jgi:hypothetical protein
MRSLAVFTVISMLALPGMALAQDASAPPPPDQPGMQPPPPDQPDAPPPPGAPPGGPAHHHDHDGAMMQKWHDKFSAANTTHDGRLTMQQAQTANMRPIVEHFSAIDLKHRGFVTFNDIMAWHLDDMAKHMERKAAALRAQD